jgi:undecaprenyl phosphate-alpha-L-ara4FN deformylase
LHIENSDSILVYFTVSGRESGSYDLHIVNDDGAEINLPEAFFLNPGPGFVTVNPLWGFGGDCVTVRIIASPIRETAKAGHEVGLHAWDHHYWQKQIARMSQHAVTSEIQKGYDLLTKILGRNPDCFAAPAWRVTPEALHALEQLPFWFESDCHGHSLFRPMIEGRLFSHVQIPTTLPTYDELIGLKCTPENYNEYLLNMIRPDRLNVLTIHAEVEGISCLALFQDFLDKAGERDIVFKPLGDILSQTEKILESGVEKEAVAGREGWLACQGEASNHFESARTHWDDG